MDECRLSCGDTVNPSSEKKRYNRWIRYMKEGHEGPVSMENEGSIFLMT